jgi:hypothetical protein
VLAAREEDTQQLIRAGAGDAVAVRECKSMSVDFRMVIYDTQAGMDSRLFNDHQVILPRIISKNANNGTNISRRKQQRCLLMPKAAVTFMVGHGSYHGISRRSQL